ncbi:DNA-processing protein DprA [Clostridium grantii]|uniref:DNA processing protein n=1 Tax=Clostridium grantii DSM 8605 TaxID=1121316 RepID=A0A1M5Y3Z2_9CLOT|nr:DNA-processing protein DprA [Clostridium grantii]SHI06790.1 DNA processing protein [Clostridium grantii DSM 8605]
MNEGDLIYWVWLTEIKGIGPVLARSLLDVFKNPEKIYKANIEELLSVKKIGPMAAEYVMKSRNLKKAENILKKCTKSNINIITLNSLNYPIKAMHISEMPIILYNKGTLKENIQGIAIVGTRRCSEYAKNITIEVAEYLAQNNVPVISGMAKGIDSYAHTACLNNNGYTIAVLGSGVDICYPREHIKLIEKIIENGAVISQYPPGTPPNSVNFPKRNKIISGISEKVLVVEAGDKSGSLITAQYAKKYGKEIYVAPGNIYSPQSKGSNKLLVEGSKIYLKPPQLIQSMITLEEKLTLNTDKNSISEIENKFSKSLNYDQIEKLIIKTICKESKSLEELVLLFKDSKVDIIEKVSVMELEGKIKVFKGLVSAGKS